METVNAASSLPPEAMATPSVIRPASTRSSLRARRRSSLASREESFKLSAASVREVRGDMTCRTARSERQVWNSSSSASTPDSTPHCHRATSKQSMTTASTMRKLASSRKKLRATSAPPAS